MCVCWTFLPDTASRAKQTKACWCIPNKSTCDSGKGATPIASILVGWCTITMSTCYLNIFAKIHLDNKTKQRGTILLYKPVNDFSLQVKLFIFRPKNFKNKLCWKSCIPRNNYFLKKIKVVIFCKNFFWLQSAKKLPNFH